ncbi:MAG: rRNA pseudouridine synthase [Bradymonadales bacterium]|nr:rRNA pseudouridine synthase [Bradymonadales bacterium]
MPKHTDTPANLAPPARPIRLQRALSLAGVASRRQAEALIAAGRVSVNGHLVTAAGTKVSPNDTLRVDGRRVQMTSSYKYLLLHKPPGVLCTLSDPEGRPVVSDLVPQRFGRLFPVGRLDWNSEGLLLLTNDGDLAFRLTHPRFGVQRVYSVKVKGVLQPDDSRLLALQEGLTLPNGTRVQIRSVRLTGQTKKNAWIEVVLAEGKNREIRRICDAVGLEVLRLIRVAYGPLTLARLKRGGYRELTQTEVLALKAPGR